MQVSGADRFTGGRKLRATNADGPLGDRTLPHFLSVADHPRLVHIAYQRTATALSRSGKFAKNVVIPF